MNALFYFVLWALIIFLMMRFGCGAHVMGHGHSNKKTIQNAGSNRPGELKWIPPEHDVDPVCQKTLKTASAKPSVHEGYIYYFCSRECRELFEAAPQLYLGPEGGRDVKELEHSNV